MVIDAEKLSSSKVHDRCDSTDFRILLRVFLTRRMVSLAFGFSHHDSFITRLTDCKTYKQKAYTCEKCTPLMSLGIINVINYVLTLYINGQVDKIDVLISGNVKGNSWHMVQTYRIGNPSIR